MKGVVLVRKLIDRLLWRFGYMRKELAISGRINWHRGERPFVDLRLPSPLGGQRVCGWVEPRDSLA